MLQSEKLRHVHIILIDAFSHNIQAQEMKMAEPKHKWNEDYRGRREKE